MKDPVRFFSFFLIGGIVFLSILYYFYIQYKWGT